MRRYTYVVDCYTGQFDETMPRVPLRSGQNVRIHVEADAREYDAFKRRLKYAGLRIDHVGGLPKLRMDVYRLVRASKD